ncbi:MAG TPA: hypothetical protein VIF15_17015 [Polyangiaceae bacterium]|jgi:hypothetical protein
MRVLSFIAMVGIAGCANGVKAGGANAGDAYPDVASFCQGYAEAECSSAVVSACGVKDPASCVSTSSAACLATQPQGTTYVADDAQKCIQLAEATYASTTLAADQMKELAKACGTQVFSGPGQARAPCSSDYDCSSKDGLACVVPFGQTAGKCYAPTTVQPGGACADEADVCTDGWFCEPKTRTCTAAANLGQSCGDGYMPCAAGLSCSGGLFATCSKKLDDGHPCTLADDCAGGLCDKAASQAEGTCASRITLTPLDSACASFEGK